MCTLYVIVHGTIPCAVLVSCDTKPGVFKDKTKHSESADLLGQLSLDQPGL